MEKGDFWCQSFTPQQPLPNQSQNWEEVESQAGEAEDIFINAVADTPIVEAFANIILILNSIKECQTQSFKSIDCGIPDIQSFFELVDQHLSHLMHQNKTLKKRVQKQCEQLIEFQQENLELRKQLFDSEDKIDNMNRQITRYKYYSRRKEAENKNLLLQNEDIKQHCLYLEIINRNKGEERESLKKSGLTQDNESESQKQQVYSRKNRPTCSSQTPQETDNIVQLKQMKDSLPQLSQAFFQSLLELFFEGIDKKVDNLKSLYNFNLQKDNNFHTLVDNKPNILLVCLIEPNNIVGGFTSNGFTKQKQQSDTAFLFNLKEESHNIFHLKKGRTSTEYNPDYVLFGNEELMIETGKNKLTSYFVSQAQMFLNYEGRRDERQMLLGHERGAREVNLLNYHLLQVTFENQ